MASRPHAQDIIEFLLEQRGGNRRQSKNLK